MNEQLKPCPFCGGAGKLCPEDYVHDDLSPRPVVECQNCDAWVPANVWNSRAQPNTCTKDGGQCEPVAIIGKDWQLLWFSPVGMETLAAAVRRTGLEIGDKLYRHPPAQAPVVPSEDDQRATFEAFFTEKAKTLPLPLGSVIRYAGGQYVSDYALFGWIVWNACLDELKRLNPNIGDAS